MLMDGASSRHTETDVPTEGQGRREDTPWRQDPDLVTTVTPSESLCLRGLLSTEGDPPPSFRSSSPLGSCVTGPLEC